MASYHHTESHKAHGDTGLGTCSALSSPPTYWKDPHLGFCYRSTGYAIRTALQNLGSPIITYTADGKGKTKTLLYQPASVERLADSPVLTGATGLHFVSSRWQGASQRHILCVATRVASKPVSQSLVKPQFQLIDWLKTGLLADLTY